MITRPEAEEIATEHVASFMQHCDVDHFTLVLVHDATIEYDFGWLFFYNSSDPIRTPIAGNAPFIVERNTGHVITTGTAHPIEHYINNYRETRDPHGCLGCEIKLFGYNYGANKIAATKAIREHVGVGLNDAKNSVDACMNGETVQLNAKSEKDAAALAVALKEALFAAERLPEDNRRTNKALTSRVRTVPRV